MSRDTRSDSSALAPLTRTSSGSMNTSTPAGTGIGCFPIRLIAASPDVGDDLATVALVAGFVAGHHAMGRGHDRGAHAALDLGDLALVGVDTAAGTGRTLQPGDHRGALVRVLELDAQRLADARGLG